MTYQNPKTDWTSSDGVTTDDLNRIEGNIKIVRDDSIYETATGTSTAITLTIPEFINGLSKTFIASAANNGSATTINGKALYKPGTTSAPIITTGKAYTIWYSSTGTCFFIKASAEGTAITSHVLATDTFSNNTDTGLQGSMNNRAGDTLSVHAYTMENLIGRRPNQQISDWAIMNGNPATLVSSSTSKFGTTSLSLTSNNTSNETYIGHGLPYKSAHKYYVGYWVMSDTANISSEVYWPEIGPQYPNSNVNCVQANTWYHNSFISSRTDIADSSNCNFRLDSNNMSKIVTMLFDGIVLVDLTAVFGTGNEPDLAHMDALMNSVGGYFTGAIMLNNTLPGGYITNGAGGLPEIVTDKTNTKTATTQSVSVGSSGTTRYIRIPFGAYLTGNNAGDGYPEITVDTSQLNALQVFSINMPANTATSGTFQYANGTTKSCSCHYVTGLTFTPKYILARSNAGSNDYETVYSGLNSSIYSESIKVASYNNATNSSSNMNFKMNAYDALCTYGAFRIPIWSSGYPCSIIAIG